MLLWKFCIKTELIQYPKLYRKLLLQLFHLLSKHIFVKGLLRTQSAHLDGKMTVVMHDWMKLF